MFGFEHSLEAYVPKEKRVHGYFTMPLLAGGSLVGRVDPARSGRTLVARKLSLDKPAAAEPMARALPRRPRGSAARMSVVGPGRQPADRSGAAARSRVPGRSSLTSASSRLLS